MNTSHDDDFAGLAPSAARLREISASPLAFCNDFPRIARRFEAWWHHEMLDRPVFLAAANSNPSRPITRRLDLLHDPDAWFAAKLADLQQLHYVGDALPYIRADFGPVLLGPLFGGRLEFAADTGWTHTLIDDEWSNEPAWTIAADNRWWALLAALLRRVADDARGRYLVCSPDLGAAADVLLNLRGATELCMDVIERPERVRRAVDAMQPAWRQAFAMLYRETVDRGAGLIHWLALWSDVPYAVPACDFSFMIGPRDFERLFLPDIAQQAASVGRAVFHLDGPGATRHVDALLDVPEIRAVQFTPGASAPSALAWVEMFRRIQARGRSVLIFSPAEEVLALCDALRPEGLAIALEVSPPPAKLDELHAALCGRFGCST